LDVSLFKPFKSAYRDSFYTGERKTMRPAIEDTFTHISNALEKVFTVENTKKSFSAVGIVPLDQRKILENLTSPTSLPVELNEEKLKLIFSNPLVVEKPITRQKSGNRIQIANQIITGSDLVMAIEERSTKKAQEKIDKEVRKKHRKDKRLEKEAKKIEVEKTNETCKKDQINSSLYYIIICSFLHCSIPSLFLHPRRENCTNWIHYQNFLQVAMVIILQTNG